MEDDPEYEITVTSATGEAPTCRTRLKEVIEAALRRHRTRSARISVVVVDDAHIARLNKLYLDRNEPTDVLAFDLRDEDVIRSAGFSPRGRPRGLKPADQVDGEIVVSMDTAAREAHERGHGRDAELALYTVHGALHLLGYRDDSEPEAALMHRIEDEILTMAGFGPVYRAEK